MNKRKSEMRTKICALVLCCILATGSGYCASGVVVKNDIKIYENLSDKRITSDYLNLVENLYSEKMNNHEYEDGLFLSDYIVKLYEKSYGKDDARTIYAKINRLRNDANLGMYNEFIELKQEAIDLYKSNPNDIVLRKNAAELFYDFSSNTKDTYGALNALNLINISDLKGEDLLWWYKRYANLYKDMGKLKISEDYLEKYYNEAVKEYGINSEEAIQYYFDKISNIQFRKDANFSNIEEYYKNVQNILSKTDKKIKDTSIVNYYKEKLYFDEALKLLDEYYDNMEEYEKENIIGLYFDIYKEIKEYDKAYLYLKDLYEYSKSYPDKSFKKLNFYKKQYEYYNAIKKYDKALDSINISLKMMEPIKDNVPMIYSEYLIYLGKTYGQKGQYDNALNIFNEVEKIYKNILPKNAYEFYNLYEAIGEQHGNKGDYDNAIKFYKKALQISDEIKGVGSVDSADIYKEISKVYYSWNNRSQAVANINHAIKIYKKVFGKNNAKIYKTELEFSYLYPTKRKSLINKIYNADRKGKIEGYSKELYLNLYKDIAYDSLENGEYEKALTYAKKAQENCFKDYQREELKNLIIEIDNKK